MTSKPIPLGLILVLVPLLLGTSPARAEDPIGAGRLRLSAQSGLTFSRTTSAGSAASDLKVGLSSDYFVVRSFSLGPSVNFGYTQASGRRIIQTGVGLNIGVSFLATESVIPFLLVTPGFGIIDTDGLGTQKNFELAGGAGVHFLVNSHVGFGLSVLYDRFFATPAITTIFVPLSFAIYL